MEIVNIFKGVFVIAETDQQGFNITALKRHPGKADLSSLWPEEIVTIRGLNV